MNISVNSEIDMKRLGEQIGRQLKGGEVIQLIGDIGAGKTTLTKGIALGLDVDEDVQSPSFTISRVYDARDGLRLAHYDFYRLQDPGILRDELQESESAADIVTIIEWADIVEDVLTYGHESIRITSTSDDTRNVEISEELGKKI